jgi:mannose-6-phosphate isomerase
MPELQPLRFEPILRQYLWGGRRLAELGKTLGDGDHYAESWEIVDHGDDQSIVAAGPLAGVSLHHLASHYGQPLFGRHHPQRQFPLLFKFLDCQRTLSVQVHPNDAQAARLDPPDLGKTEAWIILAAEPGSRVYAGLEPGVDRAALARELANGTCDVCLHQFEPNVGDCLFIEAGTVHALGAGLLVAEIQQSSDTTFRLFDWNRLDRDGKPRPLHIQESLDTIDYSRGPVGPHPPQPTSDPHVERLVACEKFVLDRRRIGESICWSTDNRFHIFTVVEGRVSMKGHDESCHLGRGDTILVPACCQSLELAASAGAVVLDMYLP